MFQGQLSGEVTVDSVSSSNLHSVSLQSVGGTVRGGGIELDRSGEWADGTRVLVTPVVSLESDASSHEHVIIVGFGLAGRCVADLLTHAKIRFTIIERNPVTVATQHALGRDIMEGDADDSATLLRAGLATSSILALTIPDEDAVLKATDLARRLNPDIYIIARTQYTSKGMKAAQLGADDVVKAEQAVALQFFDKLSQRLVR